MGYLKIDGMDKQIFFDDETNLFKILKKENLLSDTPCNGNGTCGKCKVRLSTQATKSSDEEKILRPSELSAGFRLACRQDAVDGMEIQLDSLKNYKGAKIITKSSKELVISKKRFEIKKIAFILETLGDFKNSLSEFFESHSIENIPINVYKKLSGLINESFNNFFGINEIYFLMENKNVIDVFTCENISAYGIAIDIGTTTIALKLFNLLTLEEKGVYSTINSQKKFGSDVVSRIVSAKEGHLQELSTLIHHDIIHGIDTLCTKADIKNEDIYKIAVSGNSTMLHIFLGLPVASIGSSPFNTTLTSYCTFNFKTIFNSNALTCDVIILPSISAYVGGDITAGIIDTANNGETSLLIDLGTNGEMALIKDGKIFCTSTAAGPAFEGGNISCGVASIEGAIDKIKFNSTNFSFNTIGNKEPIGLCGSGIIELVAELIKNEIIDETGAIDSDIFEDEILITKNIYFTQKDIREVQLAKSAVRAGIEVLLQESGITYKEIDVVNLAGGMGNNLNKDAAVLIGLLPNELRDKISVVGNSSLGGCSKVLLDATAESYITLCAGMAKEISLVTNTFNNLFMEYMYF